MFDSRYFISGGTKRSEIQPWCSPFGSRKSPRSRQVCNTKNTICSSETPSTLLNRVEELLVGSALAPKTMEWCSSIIKQHRDYMYLKGIDDLNPDQETFCKWVGYQSLFIDPNSRQICTGGFLLLRFVWQERAGEKCFSPAYDSIGKHEIWFTPQKTTFAAKHH